MVKVALLGGTGGCGSAFVEHALAAGHSILLLARTPSKVTTTHENLQVIQGDGTSAEDVLALCDGCDVVVSCVGEV
jgi:putative NADH-flavin reductase